ncbi:NAD-binding protein [Pseudenhygromyxa sp. WMMC2535]|uniref:NAD-binding protein n=1 Tax=Pseudenhygromyxa sp. WMMC2535 TaxID=2712867 RepID=UPI0031F8459B
MIIGAGEVGRHLARSLQAVAELILVDADAKALTEAEEGLDALTLVGDGTHRSTLAKAEVHRAALVVAVTPNDAANLVSAALAKRMGAKESVARVDDPDFYETNQGFERGALLDIDAVLCASRLVGVELLRRLAEVRARQVIPCAAGTVHVASHVLGEDAPLVSRGRSRAASWPEPVRAVIRAGAMRPVAEVTHAELGDIVLVAGAPLVLLETLHGLTPASGSVRTTIVGGGDVGVQLAQLLGPLGLLDRLIELDRGRCWTLAEQLDGVQILHGDGTNLAFLREEQVGRADALLAVTGSDEANLMTSLLARELGVDHVFALVHRPGYAGVYSHLGVSGTVSPHETIAQVIHWQQHGLDALIVGRWPLDGLAVEVLELRLGEDDVRLSDLPLEGCVPLQIAGATMRTPKPRSTLSRDDHLIVAVPTGRVATLEKVLRKRGRKRSS